ncbi:MAG: TetR/AcrR family transcriptional regulator [Acidimicrobiales bacterium]|nr:TetR/AcrR family transcriptional regulator [Acidimicrobiales bacterium]
MENEMRAPKAAEADGHDDVAVRIARRTLAARGAGYADEVRRLLDAGLAVMDRCGTESRPRVADIVAEAGLSNDAFYRHFPSKDALVTAILEDGTSRLGRYLERRMARAADPEARVRAWVGGVLAQADPDVAATTRAVLWNGGGTGGLAAGRHPASATLAALLVEPFAALGCPDPAGRATLAAHAALGRLADLLWAGSAPTPADGEALVAFLLASARPG